MGFFSGGEGKKRSRQRRGKNSLVPFLFNLVDRAHALIAPISSLQIEEKTGEASVCLEQDMLQEKRIHSHLEARRQIWNFLKHHLPLVDVLKKMGEESETWLPRTALAEAVNLIGVAPDRLGDDPSGSRSLTYYVLTVKLLNDFLRSSPYRYSHRTHAGIKPGIAIIF